MDMSMVSHMINQYGITRLRSMIGDYEVCRVGNSNSSTYHLGNHGNNYHGYTEFTVEYELVFNQDDKSVEVKKIGDNDGYMRVDLSESFDDLIKEIRGKVKYYKE